MNRLPINPVARGKYLDSTRAYFTRLLARADIIARQRNGNSIETGDFEQAFDYLEYRGRRTQILLMIAGGAVGAGIAGVAQNALDHKDLIFIAVFTAMMLLGIITAVRALKG